jgi:tRNA dimethylallyltransferase
VGQTALALHLAQQFNTEIISADSRQCYREMTIGTAKPSPEELKQVKHHFIDSHSVQEKLTAFDFERYALNAVEKIFSKSKVAVVCGGTGLYIQALCHGLDEMPKIDEVVFKHIEESFQEKGIAWLQDAVAKEDTLFFEKAEQQNPARLIRALAFVRSTGRSITHFKTGNRKERSFKILKIALELPRPELYDRINHRVDKMMEAGLVKEVQALLPFQSFKSLNTVGYSELFSFLQGECLLDRAVEKIKQHSRNYAKRQLTWFKKDQEFYWFSANDEKTIQRFIEKKINSTGLL